MQLESAARLAQKAATNEAEAFALGDNGSLRVFVFSTEALTAEEEEKEEEEVAEEKKKEEGRDGGRGDMTSGAYEVSMLCTFGLSLVCTSAVSFVGRAAVRWCAELAWGFVFTRPNLGQIFFTLAAGAAGLVGYARREAFYPHARRVYDVFFAGVGPSGLAG